tara:strand:+ start:3782 stop:4708 length:927 start_codon:yes stop_codon:yes gene_type:complete
MKKVIIFGSGFGLYGYLPALINENIEKIYVHQKNKKLFNQRQDLSLLASNVSWYSNKKEVLNKIDTVVIASTPQDQSKKISELLKYKNIKNFFLEKPLAHNPKNSIKLLEKLVKNNVNFHVGFLFKYTKWSKKLNSLIRSEEKNIKININWEFRAHHFKNNLSSWKKDKSLGGGIIRFYGIHLISLLSGAGFKKIIFSKVFLKNGNEYKWNARFKNSKGCVFEINVNSNCINEEFTVDVISESIGALKIVKGLDPFDEGRKAGLIDRRVKFISKSLDRLKKANELESLQKDLIFLWKEIEKKSETLKG